MLDPRRFIPDWLPSSEPLNMPSYNVENALHPAQSASDNLSPTYISSLHHVSPNVTANLEIHAEFLSACCFSCRICPLSSISKGLSHIVSLLTILIRRFCHHVRGRQECMQCPPWLLRTQLVLTSIWLALDYAQQAARGT